MCKAYRPTAASDSAAAHLGRALDAVGDRWTLLVVAQLMDGPRTYTALAAGIDGVATNTLASRLAGLRARGVVRKLGAGRGYALTARGRELLPAIEALQAWGARHRPLPRAPRVAATLRARGA